MDGLTNTPGKTGREGDGSCCVGMPCNASVGKAVTVGWPSERNFKPIGNPCILESLPPAPGDLRLQQFDLTSRLKNVVN